MPCGRAPRKAVSQGRAVRDFQGGRGVQEDGWATRPRQRREPRSAVGTRHEGAAGPGSRCAPCGSRPAAMRALCARSLVIPAVFALTYEGFGNLQMALFAAFGGFAHLTVTSFGGGPAGQDHGAPWADRDREHRADYRHGGQRDRMARRAGHDPGSRSSSSSPELPGPTRPAGPTARCSATCCPAATPGTVSMIPGPAGGLVAGLGRRDGRAVLLLLARRRRGTGCARRRPERPARWPAAWSPP